MFLCFSISFHLVLFDYGTALCSSMPCHSLNIIDGAFRGFLFFGCCEQCLLNIALACLLIWASVFVGHVSGCGITG